MMLRQTAVDLENLLQPEEKKVSICFDRNI